jgi:hypothetical protein
MAKNAVVIFLLLGAVMSGKQFTVNVTRTERQQNSHKRLGLSSSTQHEYRIPDKCNIKITTLYV